MALCHMCLHASNACCTAHHSASRSTMCSAAPRVTVQRPSPALLPLICTALTHLCRYQRSCAQPSLICTALTHLHRCHSSAPHSLICIAVAHLFCCHSSVLLPLICTTGKTYPSSRSPPSQPKATHRQLKEAAQQPISCSQTGWHNVFVCRVPLVVI